MQWKIVFLFLAAVFTVGFSGMPGGPQDANIGDEGVQNALNFAVAQHNRRSNDMYLRRVTEVVRAQTQVVAGMKYIITVKMEKTGCRKQRGDEECELASGAIKTPPYQCVFTVWSRPWMNDIRLLEEKC